MNIRRITSTTALALALVATTSPAWPADGDSTVVTARAVRSPQDDGSWGHDSRIPVPVVHRAPSSWSHDSRIPAPRSTHDAYAWGHDSHWADGTSATSPRRTSPTR